MLRIFTSWKNPSTSAGFVPANFGSRGEHGTPRPPTPTWYSIRERSFIRNFLPARNQTRDHCVRAVIAFPVQFYTGHFLSWVISRSSHIEYLYTLTSLSTSSKHDLSSNTNTDCYSNHNSTNSMGKKRKRLMQGSCKDKCTSRTRVMVLFSSSTNNLHPLHRHLRWS